MPVVNEQRQRHLVNVTISNINNAVSNKYLQI